jgi:hypothetical protein
MGKSLNSIYINECFLNIGLLLYVDDLSQLAYTVGRLQRRINRLQEFGGKWVFEINEKKIKWYSGMVSVKAI